LKKIKLIIGLFLTLLFLQTCRDPFEATSKLSGQNLLVVEGFINVGPGITKIKVSRVVGLNEGSKLVPEKEAVIFIEDDQGIKYALQNFNNGTYESEEFNLNILQDYRIRIETGEKVYLSEFTTPLVTPKIDSVAWESNDEDFVVVHVNTHDPLNRTFYYKWEYEEVWEVRSNFQSKWAYQNGTIRIRNSDETTAMSYCWQYNRNTDFLMASSENLSSNAIRFFPLNTFSKTSPRLGWRYSMTVTQRTLTSEEYEFLQIIKRNSNDLGSFFDSQPSQLFGNLHCTSSTEQVVGYIGSYSSDTKQLILKRNAISDFLYNVPCPDNLEPVLLSDPLFDSYLPYWTPVDAIYGPLVDEDIFTVIGFSLGRNYCVDCRLTAGNASKPDFWVDEDEEIAQ